MNQAGNTDGLTAAEVKRKRVYTTDQKSRKSEMAKLRYLAKKKALGIPDMVCMTVEQRSGKRREAEKRYRLKYPEKKKAKDRRHVAKHRERRKETHRKWREKNREKVNAGLAKWKAQHPGYGTAGVRKWREQNKERASDWVRQNYAKNKEKLLSYQQQYRRANLQQLQAKAKVRTATYAKIPQWRAVQAVRNRVQTAIRLQGFDKKGKTAELLGCNWQQFAAHIESLFSTGMTWCNWGLFGWHIDHIVPLSSVVLNDLEQQKRVCHYTNLRPLWAIENLRKGAKTNWQRAA